MPTGGGEFQLLADNLSELVSRLADLAGPARHDVDTGISVRHHPETKNEADYGARRLPCGLTAKARWQSCRSE